MSKALDSFFQKAAALKNAANKFTPNATEGGRIIPSPPKDADFQLRIDAGHYNPKTRKLNVVLQVNKEARSPGLRDWTKKNTTHAKLATATFDTKASDQKAEYQRVLHELETTAKRNFATDSLPSRLEPGHDSKLWVSNKQGRHDTGSGQDAGRQDGGSRYDTGSRSDAGSRHDAGRQDGGSRYDTGSRYDAGSRHDAGRQDGGSRYDTGSRYDAGSRHDAGRQDGGSRYDTGSRYDAGSRHDAGRRDSSSRDFDPRRSTYDRRDTTQGGNPSALFPRYSTTSGSQLAQASSASRERSHQAVRPSEQTNRSQRHIADEMPLIKQGRHHAPSKIVRGRHHIVVKGREVLVRPDEWDLKEDANGMKILVSKIHGLWTNIPERS